ncbi:MAG TPA: pyridoxal phosphate-dependent aminotransferase family protein [Candidatus Desulfaltia sp.]|nr:pyridoxal phosphate-dependent aminotransferase family protein [Candidatus Desulfaltia sp.]
MRGMESAPGAETILDGRRYLYFCGTGYFGLHGHPAVLRAGVRAFPKYGTHSATTRAGFGDNPVLLEVEDRLREFFREEDAVYFGSGYLGSLVLGQALADLYDIVFVDELAHFCVMDAVRTLDKPVIRFRHRDPDDLEKKLKRRLRPRHRPFLMTDGVFPVFGRIAPLPIYAKILAPYEGLIGLDDAHGVGVLGPNGRGTREHFGMKAPNLHFSGTLSKAFGGHGGFVAGKRKLIGRIRADGGAYIGSTPTPTPIAAATAKGIEILMKHPEMRDRLRRNVAAVKTGMRTLGIEVEDSPVPIVAWSMGSEDEMRKIQERLLGRGIAIAYLKYIGAPAAGVLRVSIFSTHTAAQIRRLLDELARVL